jgi:hypothetical protein
MDMQKEDARSWKTPGLSRLQLEHLRKQLGQIQTIEALRRQVETSYNSARDAQALLRSSQEQQLQHSRMLPPITYPSGTGRIISNTTFVPPLSTPSMGMHTRKLHGPEYYHVGSSANKGYAEQMRAIMVETGSNNLGFILTRASHSAGW